MTIAQSPGGRVAAEASLADGLHLVHKRYPQGLRMGRHAHDEWRFCLALHGSYTDSWRQGYRTRTPWQLSLHPVDEMHTSVFHTTVECFHVELRSKWRERLLGDAGIAPEPHEFLDGRLPMLAGQLYQEFRHGDACSPLVAEGIAFELIGWAARERRADPHRPAWVDRAKDLLRDRFTERLRIADIATELGVHPVHLARDFKRHVGYTVGDYVRRLRVDFACRELPKGGKLSVLALQAGFSDQSHLTRVFKRVTGWTPRQFRARR
jgi:AraC family transcriptional regulator